MRLQRLRLHRLPGIDGAFELNDLTGGLNVIVGRNGSGKSSMCRAIRALLWGAGGTAGVACEGAWIDEASQRRLDAELEYGRVNWREHGRIVPGPTVPDESLSRCYVIGVEDLMASDGEADLAGRVLREMMAGVDPGAIRRDQFTTGPRIGYTERSRLKEARARLHEAEVAAAQLDDAIDRLPKLERRRDEARRAQIEVQRLERLREVALVQARAKAARQHLEAFPAEAQRVRGDELDTLDTLHSRRAEADSRRQRLRHELDHARSELADRGEVPDGVVEADVQVCREWASELGQLAAEHDGLKRRLEPLRIRSERLESRVGGTVVANGWKDDRLAELESWLRRREGAAREVEALDAERRAICAMTDGSGDASIETLSRQVEALRSWMRLDAAEARSDPTDRLALGLAVVLVMLGAGVCFLTVVWGVTMLIAGGIGLGLYFGFRKQRIDRHAVRRQHAEAAVCASGLEIPAEPAEGLVADLEGALASARMRGAKRELVDRLDQRLSDAHRQLGETDRGYEALCTELGADPGTIGDVGLVGLATDVIALIAVHDEHAAGAGELRLLGERINGLRTRIVETLRQVDSKYSVPEDIDAARLEVDVHSALDRFRTARELRDQVNRLEGSLREIDEELVRVARETARVYHGAGLSDGDRNGLRRLVEVRPEYEAAIRAAAEEAAIVRQLEAGLSARDAGAETLPDAGELEVAIEEQRRTASTLEEVVEEIRDIELATERALREQAVGTALAAVEEAEQAVARVRTTALHASAGAFLLERAERAHCVEQQPEVVREAGRLLDHFTRGRYELLPPNGHPDSGAAFVVRDLVTDRIHPVGELSTGTRAQLLLAIRLAFAEASEGETKLPLFLDEALSSSDPDRFDAVIRALGVVAGEGRQVFYMTCQPRDWYRIREELTKPEWDGDRVPVRLIKLDAVRRLSVTEEWLSTEDAAPGLVADVLDRVPAYRGEDPVMYAEALGVARFDPAMSPVTVHPFHVLEDDPGRVEGLVRRGIISLGQLKRTRLDMETLARIAVVEAFCEAWRIGRGRSVDRDVLCRGGISENFIDAVWSLAKDVDRDASALVDGLRARRVRKLQSRIIEGLAETLESEGYLDLRERLDSEAIRQRVLNRLRRHVDAGTLSSDAMAARVDGLLAQSDMAIGVA